MKTDEKRKLECCVPSCSLRFEGTLKTAIKEGWRRFKEASPIQTLGAKPRWWDCLGFCPRCCKRYGVEP